jgi:hypothetical protein
MYVYIVTRLMNGETSVFGDACPTRNAAEEAIKIDRHGGGQPDLRARGLPHPRAEGRFAVTP